MTEETKLMNAVAASLMHLVVGAGMRTGALRRLVEVVASETDVLADDLEAALLGFVTEVSKRAREDADKEKAQEAAPKTGSEMARDATRTKR